MPQELEAGVVARCVGRVGPGAHCGKEFGADCPQNGRGLCEACYARAWRAVRAELTTWDCLEGHGYAVPVKKDAPRPGAKHRLFAAAAIAREG